MRKYDTGVLLVDGIYNATERYVSRSVKLLYLFERDLNNVKRKFITGPILMLINHSRPLGLLGFQICQCRIQDVVSLGLF